MSPTFFLAGVECGSQRCLIELHSLTAAKWIYLVLFPDSWSCWIGDRSTLNLLGGLAGANTFLISLPPVIEVYDDGPLQRSSF